ncbi:MAG: TldD/PmbA family protein [Bacteroidales bacterium]|nr:TldD/PmbA family protein [Bacteroidales bacterium]MBN2762570.1 TldD/PmbA family protein [Bacteroidales bacterium]
MNAAMQELLNWVIDQTKKAGAPESKVSVSKRRFVDIRYREKRPDTVKEAMTQNLNLEVFMNGRYCSQSTPDLRKSTLEKFIKEVVENASILDQDPYRTLPDPKYFTGITDIGLDQKDTQHGNYSAQDRHNVARSIEEMSLSKGGEKVISVEATCYDSQSEEYVKTSNGFEGSVEETYYSKGASVTMQDEGDRRPNSGYWVSSRIREDLPDSEEVGNLAAVRTMNLLGSKKISTETLPVILENRGAGRLLNGFIQALAGWNIQQKRSFLADMKNKQVGSKVFTLIDDPHIVRGLGSRKYDGDGITAVRREIVKEGLLLEFFIDWYYSRKLECEPTTSWPSNLILPPGNRSVEAIMKGLGRGILITDYLGGNSNSTTGDFSVGIIGQLFDKGRIVHPVSEMNIADNHLKFWNKLIEVANDPWNYSSYRLPSMVFKDVVVAGV